MDITLKPCRLFGSITGGSIVSSKSYAHRVLICSAFSDKPTSIKCSSDSLDICATVGALSSLGAEIVCANNIFTVKPISGICSSRIKIDCMESGSTLRFILPIIGALGAEAEISGKGRLSERPLSPLYEQLLSHGMILSENGKLPLTCSGRLTGKSFVISGGVSSQFVTGLMFALAIMGGGEIKVDGKLESCPYVDMTADVLNKFGIEAACNNGIYSVSNGKLHSPEYVEIENDWSSAAFWLAAGAFSDNGISVSSMNMNSVQGDRDIVGILKKFGAEVAVSEDTVAVRRSELHGIELDASDIPDLVPVISVIGAAANGITVINGISRLRFKESDRVVSVCSMLDSLGVKAESDDCRIVIYGGKIRGGTVNSYNDHRIVMSAAVASSLSEYDITIKGAEAVKKSYPSFFDVLKTLGAECRINN